ncbi:hypothetical protein [Streptomyces sp. BP-8]|uniref:Uncharacterized protein n=1 Tax=Streptomyces sirii TaxID=3127701 RepID=A0ABZ2QNL7_9ACTN
MNHPVGTEIDATAKWLEARGADGAAMLLRRVACQRDQARRELATERESATGGNAPSQQSHHTQQESADTRCATPHAPETARIIAMLRTDLARFQALAEHAGWVSDARPRRLWRWREGWWELCKKNSKDGYQDTGWHLWGPNGIFGEWIAAHKADAMTEADRLITQHLAAAAEVTQ